MTGRVLILEPDVVLGRSYKRALQLAGYDVTLQATAQGAVHAMDTQVADVVVLELQLARHNGIEFLHELRSYPEWDSVPVLLHTVVPEADLSPDPVVWKHLGVSTCLYKSHTSLAQLVQAVHGVLA